MLFDNISCRRLGRPDAGTWSLVHYRTAHRVNEIADITESTGPAWVTPAYVLGRSTEQTVYVLQKMSDDDPYYVSAVEFAERKFGRLEYTDVATTSTYAHTLALGGYGCHGWNGSLAVVIICGYRE